AGAVDSVTDQGNGRVDDARGGDPFCGWSIPARQTEQSANDLLDPVGLRRDGGDRARQLLVARHLRLQLLCSGGDHAERRGDLVSDADRQGAEGGRLARPLETLVAPTLQTSDGQLSFQQQLL